MNTEIHISDKGVKRFWQQVNVCGENECWDWLGFITKRGYGRFKIGEYSRPAHRVALFLESGLSPENDIHHLCHNKRCCNPKHLIEISPSNHAVLTNGERTYLETQYHYGDEHWSRKKPELVLRGKYHNMAELTEEQVLEIRKLHRGGCTQRMIASKFGVSFQHISSIVNRKRWKHLE